MSNTNIQSQSIRNTNFIRLSGEMTFDNNEMMNELGGKIHCLFDIENVISKIKDMGRDKLTYKVTELVKNGNNIKFYVKTKFGVTSVCVPVILPTICFHPWILRIDKNFARIRDGVGFFYDQGFDIYIIPIN